MRHFNNMKIISLLFACFLVITVLLANQGALPAWLEFLKSFYGGDKVGHFILMGSMAFLLNITLRQRRVNFAGMSVLLGSLIVMLVVTVEEFSQLWLPLRTFDWGDLLADYLGIAVLGNGISLLQLARRQFPRH